MNDIRDQNRAIARAYFAAVSAGELPDELLTPDMTAWLTNGGTVDRPAYQRLVRLLGKMCAAPMVFSIHAITTEEDRVVAEASSEAVLINGAPYSNVYVFIFRIRDGRIASVAEHYNALTAREKLVPLMEQAAARL